MVPRVLVAYASKYGATAEIAEKIGDVLRAAGLKVNVLSAGQVHELSPFNAVVLGSAVYADAWCAEAVKFFEESEVILEYIPVWLFSSGPTGEGDPSSLMKGWHFPKAQQHIADRIHPRDIAFFHGKIDMEKLNFAEKLIIKGIKAPIGDFRDWNVITSWASNIAASLHPQTADRE